MLPARSQGWQRCQPRASPGIRLQAAWNLSSSSRKAASITVATTTTAAHSGHAGSDARGFAVKIKSDIYVYIYIENES